IRVQHRNGGVEVDLDAGLANQLFRAGKLRPVPRGRSGQGEWGENLAIITLAVSDQGNPRLVKTEFFTDFDLQLGGKNSYKKKLKIVYNTLTVTPEGQQNGIGNPDDWAQGSLPEERLFHISNQLRAEFERMAYQQSQAKWNAFNSQLSSMFQRGLQSA